MRESSNSYKFNVESDAIIERLSDNDREKYVLISQTRAEEVQRIESDYERHKDKRISDKEDDLTRHYEAKIAEPRPPWVPPPRMPTPQEIKVEAREKVAEAHETRLEETRAVYDLMRKQHLERCLGREAVYGRER